MLIFSKKNNKISKCFYEHIESVAECYENFEKFFEILFADQPDPNRLKSAEVAINNCENAADVELRRTVDMMKEAFLPLTRSNMISIAQSTDDIANKCESVARQIYLENIVIPTELRPDIVDILKITRGQLQLLNDAIDKLLNDFNGISKNKSILDDIRTEESKVDSIEAMLHTRIFNLDISLCEKIYYKDLLESICQISDIIEDIADQIQIMIVEREA